MCTRVNFLRSAPPWRTPRISGKLFIGKSCRKRQRDGRPPTRDLDRVRPQRMMLQIKVAKLRELFGTPAETPLIAALEDMLRAMHLPLAGSLPQQVDKLCETVGIVVSGTAPVAPSGATCYQMPPAGTSAATATAAARPSDKHRPSSSRHPRQPRQPPAITVSCIGSLRCQILQTWSGPQLFQQLRSLRVGQVVGTDMLLCQPRPRGGCRPGAKTGGSGLT